MHSLSNALKRVRMSPSVAIQTRALELRAEGRDIVALSAGEPDFDTPEPIRDAANRAIREGRTRYTAVDGIIELKQAICGKFRRENGLEYDTSQISVAAGGKQAIYNALCATLNPGDEVIVTAPYWVSYPDMVNLCGGTPVIVGTSTEGGFKVTPEALESAISAHSRWLLLNSPGNPSGAVYSAAELEGLAGVLRRHPQVSVLSDDIYEHIVYAPARFATLAAVAPDLKDRVLTVNGMSKAYAMTGWRIGYAAGPAELIRAMRTIQSQTTGNPCSISQWAAVAALDTPDDVLEGFRRGFEARRNLVVEQLNAIDGIHCPTPDGAFYVYPDITAFIGKATADSQRLNNDEDFALALLESHDVAVVHGAAFGLSPHFRVSYAASKSDLIKACQRIRKFCESLSGNSE